MGWGAEDKELKKKKQRFPNFPRLFPSLSPSTLKGLSDAGVGAARGRICHWLRGWDYLHLGCYKNGGGARLLSSGVEKGRERERLREGGSTRPPETAGS